MDKATDRRLQLSETLGRFVQYCETNCVAECCGVAACEFTKDNVDRWLQDHPEDRDVAIRELNDVLHEIEGQSEDTVSSRVFNEVWKKSEATLFFWELLNLVKGIA
jgi:hypothetical protein